MHLVRPVLRAARHTTSVSCPILVARPQKRSNNRGRKLSGSAAVLGNATVIGYAPRSGASFDLCDSAGVIIIIRSERIKRCKIDRRFSDERRPAEPHLCRVVWSWKPKAAPTIGLGRETLRYDLAPLETGYISSITG